MKMSGKSFILSKYVYIFLFVVGAIAFLYPLVTSLINYQAQTHVISSYEEDMQALSEQEKKELRTEAENYNMFVAGLEGNVTDKITDAEREASDIVYMNVLATGEAIGHVEIPKLDIDLPIYRGASEEVLSQGIGHLERSSLPIGGENTHSVLTGHRGLPSSRLFRDLDKLVIGDVFLIDSLDEKLAYEVESIRVVLPHEVESLQIQEGRDLSTLITCEPYMINSHRMLVTGHRIDYVPTQDELIQDGKISFFEKYIEYFIIVGVFFFLLLVVWLFRRFLRKRKDPLQGGLEGER